jgi:hypothetical protein
MTPPPAQTGGVGMGQSSHREPRRAPGHFPRSHSTSFWILAGFILGAYRFTTSPLPSTRDLVNVRLDAAAALRSRVAHQHGVAGELAKRSLPAIDGLGRKVAQPRHGSAPAGSVGAAHTSTSTVRSPTVARWHRSVGRFVDRESVTTFAIASAATSQIWTSQIWASQIWAGQRSLTMDRLAPPQAPHRGGPR